MSIAKRPCHRERSVAISTMPHEKYCICLGNPLYYVGHIMVKNNRFKLLIGLLIGAGFMFLAFRKVDFAQMGEALKRANYWYILLSLFFVFFAHWLRAVRWRYLMAPIQKVKTGHLFSALLIGYMANTFTPAHLGEFLRAYVLSKKSHVKTSSVFGTIVIERVIDVFTLLFLMALTFVVFPFPSWVTKSGYLTFAGTLILIVLLVVMKRNKEKSLRILNAILNAIYFIFLKIMPKKISLKMEKSFHSVLDRVDGLFHSFFDGVVGLKNWRHYIITTVLSLLIWAGYGISLQISFYAFDFVSQYNLPWTAALVTLVITTISIIVPSTPGYVGTYHLLCQLSLGMFAIPKSEALSFAFVLHGINFIPILIVGLVIASVEGISISKKPQTSFSEENGTCGEESPGDGSCH